MTMSSRFALIHRLHDRRILIGGLVAFTNLVILVSLLTTASRPAQAQDQLVPLPTNDSAALALINPETTQEPPNTPVPTLEGFVVVSADAGEVTLGWDDDGSAVQVILDRSIDHGATWVPLATAALGAEEYIDTGLLNGMSYGYRGRVTGQPVETASVVWYDAGSLNVLVNGGMEYDSDDDKLPDAWKVKNAAGDKMVSNRINDPEKPNKVVAFEGDSAYLFKAPAEQNKKLIQDISDIDARAGDQMTLKVFSRAKKLSPDAKIRVKVMYFLDDGTRESFKLAVSGGTYDYTETVSNAYVASQSFEKARVVVIFRATAGKWYVDNMRLLYTPGQ